MTTATTATPPKKGEYFRGKTIEELKTLSLAEFAKLLPSRSRRTLTRGFSDEQKKLMKMLQQAREGKYKKPVKTHCRDMIVLPDMVGLQVQIHTGKEFQPLTITYEMIGRFLGEFALTRKKVAHSAPGIGATKSSGALSVK